MVLRRSSVSVLALLMLTSCGVIPTQYMPNGYRYHDDTPLSSPAPSRPWIDEAGHPDLEHLGDNTAAWQGAVYELISPLPAILPPATTRIALTTTPPAATPDRAFDHYLRQGLISYGYNVDAVSFPTNTTLVYNASPLSNPATLKLAQAKFGPEFVKKDNTKDMYYLTLEILGPNGKTINTQSSVAVLPYEKTEYSRLPGLSYSPSPSPKVVKEPIYKTRE